MTAIPDTPPPITCAKCEQQVKSVHWWQDGWEGDLIIEAACHGEVQRVAVEVGQVPPAVMFKAKVPEEDCA